MNGWDLRTHEHERSLANNQPPHPLTKPPSSSLPPYAHIPIHIQNMPSHRGTAVYSPNILYVLMGNVSKCTVLEHAQSPLYPSLFLSLCLTRLRCRLF